jgi:hypothetical protein
MFRTLQARFAGLLLACAAAPAIAQTPPEWGTQIVFDTRESFTTTIDNLTSSEGQSRFWFETSGALDIRILLHDGYGDADLLVFKDSPNGTFLCGQFAVGNDEECRFRDPAPGKYFIQVITDRAYAQVKLSTSVLPAHVRSILDIPDEPYQFVRRTDFFDPVPDYVECLEARVDPVSHVRTMSGNRCVPMGSSQQWRLVKTWNNGVFHLRNPHNLCLFPEHSGKGARVVERNCDGSYASEWEFMGVDGRTHYTWIVNRSTWLCMDIQPAGGPALMVDCTWGGADVAKAWRLRTDDERAKAQPVNGGVLRNKDGYCMIDDSVWGMLGPCNAGSPHARYVFAPAYTIGSGDKWSGQFVIHPNGDKTLCISVDAINHAAIVGCDPTDVGQRWRTEASFTGLRFPNMRTGGCLNSQGGQSYPGIFLATIPCGTFIPTSIWTWFRS